MTYEIERIANGWLVRSNPLQVTGAPKLQQTFTATLEMACERIKRHHLDPHEKGTDAT